MTSICFEGVDCVIRGGHLPDSEMIPPAARRVAGDHLRQPGPISPGTAPSIRLKDRRATPMIGFVSSRTHVPCRWALPGWPSERRVSLPCRLLTYVPTSAPKRQGGWPVSEPPAEADLASGALTEVLADFRLRPLPLLLLYPVISELSARYGYLSTLGDGADETSSAAASGRLK